MTAEHNHQPRCCCSSQCNTILAGDKCEEHTCPACVEHGELARTECPKCHQLAGRPHTEFCPADRSLSEDGPIHLACGWPEGHHSIAGACPCPLCGLLDGRHKPGCPATRPGAPG